MTKAAMLVFSLLTACTAPSAGIDLGDTVTIETGYVLSVYEEKCRGRGISGPTERSSDFTGIVCVDRALPNVDGQVTLLEFAHEYRVPHCAVTINDVMLKLYDVHPSKTSLAVKWPDTTVLYGAAYYVCLEIGE